LTDGFQPRDYFIPYGIFLAIVLLAFLSPSLGMFAGVFVPVPLILVYLQRGKVSGLITITGVALVLLVLVGPQLAIAFVSAYGIMAATMAEATRLSVPFDKTILFSALAPAVLTGLLVLVGMTGESESLVQFLEKALKEEAEGYLEILKKSGESPESLKAFSDFMGRATPLLARIFPAFILVSSLVGAVINFLAVRFLWLRFYSRKYFEGVDIARFMLPDILVWVLIGSIGSLMMGMGLIQTLGMNLAFVSLFLYFFQGLAVVAHILKAKNFPAWIWVIVFGLILLNPMFMGLVIGAGLFDIWADFRKIRITAPPASRNSME
jgi:uncharacterized protein YybS (DUF2232 family)